jgi:hypothetical protein
MLSMDRLDRTVAPYYDKTAPYTGKFIQFLIQIVSGVEVYMPTTFSGVQMKRNECMEKLKYSVDIIKRCLC